MAVFSFICIFYFFQQCFVFLSVLIYHLLIKLAPKYFFFEATVNETYFLISISDFLLLVYKIAPAVFYVLICILTFYGTCALTLTIFL